MATWTRFCLPKTWPMLSVFRTNHFPAISMKWNKQENSTNTWKKSWFTKETKEWPNEFWSSSRKNPRKGFSLPLVQVYIGLGCSFSKKLPVWIVRQLFGTFFVDVSKLHKVELFYHLDIELKILKGFLIMVFYTSASIYQLDILL